MPSSGASTGAIGGGGNQVAPPGSPAGGTQQPPPGGTSTPGGARTPVSLDDCGGSNPAGLPEADVRALLAGSGGPGSLRVLNPYDGTVFPRGILPPTLMWDGVSGSQAVYLHIKSRLFEYKGCLAPTGPEQLDLPERVWTLLGEQTEGSADPYLIELTVIGGGAVVGPLAQHWTVAQATLKGSIYYNSYSSRLVGLGGIGGGSGAVLRIRSGGSAEAFLGAGGCTGCHSVSANGQRMLALPLGGLGGPGNPAASYELTPQVGANPPPINARLANGAFTGLSPDGSLFITNAHTGGPRGMGPRAGAAGAIGGPTSILFETDSGMEVAGSGLVTGAMMSTFAPNSRQIVFTDLALGQGHGLATMDFDPAARVASGYKEVLSLAGDEGLPGWPFFLPDEKGIVFSIGTATDFSGLGAGIGIGGVLTAGAPPSDIFIADVASGQKTMLAQAMGFASAQDAQSGATYLPFGAAELHHHYYPTVAPVAAGGYFWVFFDSIRHYGNQGVERQIWGTAVDVAADGTYLVDRSHPAFYLTGQEAATGNHRAFAALDPCETDGETCTSGTDCCGGFCFVEEVNDEFGSEPVGTCTSEVPECARTNERCSTDDDCCPPEAGRPAVSCIAGFCATLQTLE